MYTFQKNIEYHTHTIILLHGYSCTAQSMRSYAVNINKRLPTNIGIKYVCLQAPKRYIDCYDEKKYAWYNYFTDYCDKEEEIDLEHVKEMIQKIKEITEKETKLLNNDYSKIFIAGNSQGACQAIATGLSIEKKLGGILSFRGHYITDLPVKNKQDIWVSHGEKDDTIGFDVAKNSFDILKNRGCQVTTNYQKYLDHNDYSSYEFNFCVKWLIPRLKF